VLAVLMGVLWERLGRPEWLRPPAWAHRHDGARATAFRLVFQQDFLQAAAVVVAAVVGEILL
jgi:hypothetical protein